MVRNKLTTRNKGLDRDLLLKNRVSRSELILKRSKQQKLKDKSKVAARRKLEELHEIRSLESEFESLNFDEDLNEKVVRVEVPLSNEEEDEPTRGSTTDSSTEYSPLFVLEADDFDDLSLTEVEYIWENRLELCGSIEAGAEALALLEVHKELVANYLGWQHYVNSPELDELRDKIQSSETHESKLHSRYNWPRIEQTEPLTQKAQIKTKSLPELEKIWSKRPFSLGSIEIACEILSELRFQTGIDKHKQKWQSFLKHPTVLSLKDELPERTQEDHNNEVDARDTSDTLQTSEVNLLEKDNRQTSLASRKVRSGQQVFRKIILERFNNSCCVTDCSEVELLEAAHIMPYMGEQSNVAENGLCLRVDIHKLFDRFLISINPEDFKLIVSKRVKDDFYTSLNNKVLFPIGNEPSRAFLQKHHNTFCKLENQ